MSRLDELDRRYVIEGDPVRDVPRQVWPAHFEDMTPEELAGWPTRGTGRWARERLPWLLPAAAIAGGVGFWTGSVPVATGVLGLMCDVLGVWMLTEGLLLTDEEFRFR